MSHASVVGSMLWGRITGLHGYENYQSNYSLPSASAATSENLGAWYFVSDQATTEIAALQWRGTLLFIIFLHPMLMTVFIAAKAWLYSSPIADRFGLVSMLAGVSKESSSVLEGAALSGKLKRPIRVQILVTSTPVNEIASAWIPAGLSTCLMGTELRGR
jgi:hypothetical protein